GAEYVSFQRSLRNGNFVDENGVPQLWYDNFVGGLDRAEGERMHLQPGISLPLQWAWGFVTPSVKYAYTRYDLDLDNQAFLVSPYCVNRSINRACFDDSPDRGVPILSLDSGLYFDRQSSLFGTAMRQTFEPRAYYLYVPNEDQTDIPVFDTSESSFSY